MREKIIILFCFIILGKIQAQSVLSIRSKPDKANVYINNVLYGKTPIELLNIDAGFKTIKLEKDSLKIWQANVFMKKDSSIQIFAVMDGNYGLLTLRSDPLGADVYVNDTLIGKTPLDEYKIKTGINYIKIEKENYLTWENYIEITHMQKLIYVNLIRPFGSLSFKNISSNQNIYIDGQLLDKNKLKKYILPIGNHEIHLSDKKFNKEIYDNIDVAPENHYDVSFNYDQFSFKPLLISAFIPGMGQIYNKSYIKGTLIFVSTIASGFYTVWAIKNYHRKNDEYKMYQDEYYSASTEADALYYHSMTQNAYEKTNTASTLRDLGFGALVGLYLYNLVDAILFSSKIDIMHYYQQKNHVELKNEIGYKKFSIGIQWDF
jgi:archaellum component FlaF (FlaF/FlaG flagellin family)